MGRAYGTHRAELKWTQGFEVKRHLRTRERWKNIVIKMDIKVISCKGMD